MARAVVIVLGAGVEDDGSLSPTLARRVEKGVELGEKMEADLLLTGGLTNPNITLSEADAAKSYVERKHRPSFNIFTEDQSTTTFENAKFSKSLIEQQAWQDITIVSDDTHMRRAKLVFQAFGIKAEYVGVEACKGRPIIKIFYGLRELVAIFWYQHKLKQAQIDN